MNSAPLKGKVEEISCKMVPMDNHTTKEVYLPDGEQVVLGPTSEMNEEFSSPLQIACVAEYKYKRVHMIVCGAEASVVDEKVLKYGESCYGTNDSIIELVQDGPKYRVVFDTEQPVDRNAAPETKPVRKLTKKELGVFKWESLSKGEVLFATHNAFARKKNKCVKVAAFDLEGTLIKTKSGNDFPKNINDWMIWHELVNTKLLGLHKKGYKIVIFTHEETLTMCKGKIQLTHFKKAVEIILGFLEVPVFVYIFISNEYYRKPSPGMWKLMMGQMSNCMLNLKQSFYVGDEAGRPEGWKPGKNADFSSSDRMFALNTRLKFFTPEEFFLEEASVTYPKIKFHPGIYEDGQLSLPVIIFPKKQEVILMVGSPASGKSHFARSCFFEKHYHFVKCDSLNKWQKCVENLKELLELNQKVVISISNPDSASRQRYTDICKKMGIPIRCFVMKTSLDRCMHNNKFRLILDSSELVVESQVIKHYFDTFEPPTLEEGFTELLNIPFIPSFKEAEHEEMYYYYLLA